MNKRIVFTVATLCVLTAGSAMADIFATPGGVDKKYVGLFFDVFNTTPSNILANADQFAEKAPYLDGVAIGLNRIPVVTPEGGVVTSAFYKIMHPTQRWTRDELKTQLPYLKAIAQKPNLGESMLLFWMTPYQGSRIDWGDDKGWANYAENMANVAWLAKEAGLKGLMLDPEEYDAQGGKLAQYIHSYKDPPFPETAKLARQRGREVFSRVFGEFPDAVIFSLWCFHKFNFWMDGGRQPYPVNNVDQSGELLHHYLNGMLDVMPPAARVVDGAEQYSGTALNHVYTISAADAFAASMALVAPENVAKMRSQFYFSNTHYFDMYRMNADPKSFWYHGPVHGSRLEHMRINFEQSLNAATKYVWLYGEGNGKLFDWRDGHYAKKKTWEELAPGMTETIMLVKNPLGLAAERKAKLAKEGKLVNLAKGVKGFVIEQPEGEREFHQREDEMPSARNLRPGDRYYVSIEVTERAADQKSFRDGIAIPRAFWRKNGKRTSSAPFEIPIFRNRNRGNLGALRGGLEVEVPANADELVFDLGSSLQVGEYSAYWSLLVNNILDPKNAVKPAKRTKWTFDAEKKILTDGNWNLTATFSQKKDCLVVSGDDEKTVGSGVLDLSTVRDDTGYPVVKIGKLKNIQSMTALYAPDVKYVGDGGIAGCSNVTAVAIGEMDTDWKAVTPMEKRVERLKSLGCAIKMKTGFKRLERRHRRIVTRKPPEPIFIKGVEPGALYSVGLSMKRHGPGYVYIFVRFRGKDGGVISKMRIPQIVMSEPRADDVWQSGEVVARVPQGADEILFDISTEITEGYSRVEMGDFKVYKIGEPLPVWPEESLRKIGQ